MSDAVSLPPQTEPSAGALLRAAREKQGVHVAVLAASIKVTRNKLEALEADRYDELPDMTFTRALAQAVCRALKIDAAPVLARLPRTHQDHRIDQLGGGLNAPFRERPGHREPADLSWLGRPVFWAVVIVLVATALLYVVPASLWEGWLSGGTAPAASLPGAPGATAATPLAVQEASNGAVQGPASAPVTVETVFAAPSAGEASEAVAAPAGIAVLRTQAESWVEVQDAKGQMLLSRTLQAGETVGIDGAVPLRVTIGNVTATQLVFRGRPVDLAAAARDNVVRMELK